MTTNRLLVSAALIAAAALCGCRGENALRPEPTGGNWKPILGAPPTAPPPPSNPAKDIDSLLSLQARRSAAVESTVAFWGSDGLLRWNEIALGLVAKRRTDHACASRVYALLSVAQYDAAVAAWKSKYLFNRPAPATLSTALHPLLADAPDPTYPSAQAAMAAASAAVLAYLFPGDSAALAAMAAENEAARLYAGVNYPSDIAAGDALGRYIAAVEVARARGDGSDAVWKGSLPVGPHLWMSAANDVPLLPLWGRATKPWLMVSDSQFRAPPPPPFASPEFRAALSEVRRISDTRTTEQARIAALWADGPGSYAPAGRWNKIAGDLIRSHRLNEIRSARILALLNMALMDAGIACWESKYHYLVPRPSQADVAITTPVGLPNFPSYPSAHSVFSGAAAEVLGYFFPAEKDSLEVKAGEASISRVFGGIHYRFDMDAGLAMGRAVGQLAIAKARSDGAP